MTKNLKEINYKDAERMMHMILIFENNSRIYITVQRGMIYVADCSYEELCKRIENDDTESFEAYDTIDGCDYYSKSEYAEYINCLLLRVANRYL